MPVSRMRMRPWLEQMIDSRRFDGLYWVDREKKIFTVPWRHAARHGWEIGKDASLFKEWAIHTGKYVEGQECDPKTWKANFRCALNSLPDIEEVKNKSVHKGNGAMRVFQILPLPPKTKDRRGRAIRQKRQTKVKYESSDTSDSDSVPSPPLALMPTLQDRMDSTIDSTVKSELPDHSYINSDDVPIWSRPGFEFPRKFEVSPAHSTADNADDEIIKLCEEWERERQGTMGNNGFLYNELMWRPGSPYSSGSSAADDLEEVRYTNLASSFSTTTSDDLNSLASSFSTTTTEDMSTAYSFTDSLSLQ